MPESQGGVSFIPKQPIRGGGTTKKVRKIYVLAYISFVMFFATLIAAGATFLYKISLENQLANAQVELTAQKDAFSQSDIARIQDLNNRMQSAKKVLDSHSSLTQLFASLEKSTIEQMQFKSFAYTREGSALTMVLQANTEDFNAVLFQRETLQDDSILAGSVIEELAGSQTSEVTAGQTSEDLLVDFTLTKVFTPADLRYDPIMQSEVDVQESVTIVRSSTTSSTTNVTSSEL